MFLHHTRGFNISGRWGSRDKIHFVPGPLLYMLDVSMLTLKRNPPRKGMTGKAFQAPNFDLEAILTTLISFVVPLLLYHLIVDAK
jgi:hypothetical protein